MTFTNQELEEINNFDYTALILEDIQEEDEIVEQEPKVVYPNVKIKASTQDMNHHLARLEMMMAEARGEDLS